MANNINNINRQYQRKNKNKRNVSSERNEVNSWLLKAERTQTAEELVALIISEIEKPPFHYKKVNEILRHLQEIMKFSYRNLDVKVVPFGSSVTNLAIKDSDLDVYLDFRGNLPQPPEILVRTLGKQIRRSRYFIRSIPIVARVPIVNCIHRNGISCDLSFLNEFGVINSHLLKFLLSTDERLRPLFLILKHFMRCQGLVEKNALTSFTVTCLILFFLQTLEDPIIPPICHLQNLSTEKRIIHNWDASFTTEVRHLPIASKQLSVTELLYKFFEFYSTFEFGFYVISLFTGKKYLKPIFSNPSLLPEEFHSYKANIARDEFCKLDYDRFLCIQSPFQHNYNVSRSTKMISVIQFQNLCCTNAAIGQELLKQNNLEENKVKYLMKVFSHENETPKTKKLKAEEIVIYFGEKLIFDNCNCTEEDLRIEWAKHIFSTVNDILCKVMKCDIDNPSEMSDSTSFVNDLKVINCKLHYYGLVTKKRNEVKSEIKFPENISEIQKEEIVSDYLCNTLLKDVKKAHLKFTLKCCVREKPTCFCITLESDERQKVMQIFHFMQNYFPKWIK